MFPSFPRVEIEAVTCAAQCPRSLLCCFEHGAQGVPAGVCKNALVQEAMNTSPSLPLWVKPWWRRQAWLQTLALFLDNSATPEKLFKLFDCYVDNNAYFIGLLRR